MLQNLYVRLVSMGNGTFEMAELGRFLDLCFDRTGTGSLTTRLAEYQAQLQIGMCSCQYPGYFVGLMTLLIKTVAGVEGIALSNVQTERDRLPSTVALLKFVFDEIMRNDSPERIEGAAQALQAEGERHLEQARASTQDEMFYGHLFRSNPFFYGAKLAFEYLAAVAESESDTRKSHERRDHECEEYLVYASSSLLNHFDNLHFGWAQYQQHSRRVADLRTSNGVGAAEQQVNHYTEIVHFYPAHYRDALLNQRVVGASVK